MARRLGPMRTLGLSMLVMAGTQQVIGLTSDVVVTAVALAASSAAFATLNVVARTLRQRRNPPAMLGRTNSTYLMVGRTGETLGALLGGVLATVASVRAPILAGVVLLLAAAVWTAVAARR